MTRIAFELSERHDLLFLLRLVTRVCHSRSLVDVDQSLDYTRVNRGYHRDIKFVVLPALCRQRRLILDQNLERLMADSEAMSLNRMELTSSEIGIITAGASYNYVKETYGNRYSILKLGLVWPLDFGIINRFASQYEEGLCGGRAGSLPGDCRSEPWALIAKETDFPLSMN